MIFFYCFIVFYLFKYFTPSPLLILQIFDNNNDAVVPKGVEVEWSVGG